MSGEEKKALADKPAGMGDDHFTAMPAGFSDRPERSSGRLQHPAFTDSEIDCRRKASRPFNLLWEGISNAR